MPNVNEQTQVNKLEIDEYLALILKFKVRILLFSIVTTLIVTLIVLTIAPTYRATSSLLIKASRDNTVSIDSAYSLDTSRDDYFLTQFEILKSRSVAETVIDDLNLAFADEFMPEEGESWVEKSKAFISQYLPDNFFHEEPKELTETQIQLALRNKKVALIDAFEKQLNITPIRNTQLVNISFEAKDPQLAALIANTIGDVYIKQEMLAQLNVTQKAVDWLKTRLETLRTNLEKSVQTLQAYRIKENLIDIESRGVRSMASDELESLTESYLQAKKARFEAETLFLYVNSINGRDIDALLSLPEISSHRLIEGIKAVEIEAEKKVSELSYRYGKKHPKYISARAELLAVRENLQENVTKLVKGLGKELKAAKDNEYRLFRELKEEKQKFQDVTNKEQKYIALQREVEGNRNLYNTFLDRYKEMDSTADLEVQQARIVDFAEVPLKPVKPQKKLIVVLTFFGALLIAIFFTVVQDYLNDKFRTPSDVESKLGMRLLGMLPLVKAKKSKDLSVHAYFDSDNRAFAESIRTLRTSIVLAHDDKAHKVVLVTSSVPGEGKTTTAINIAFALSQVEKTLLIEADMRKPSFSKKFRFPTFQEGLSNVISSTDKLDDVIFRDKKSSLDILPAGFIPSNPLELLSSSKFNNLLKVLKSKYDRIVIDSPPTQAVSDAMVLAQQSDSVIYVVRSELTKQVVVKQGLSRLLQVTSKIDGIVLNRVDIAKHSKEGAYQGYYDHYGYSK